MILYRVMSNYELKKMMGINVADNEKNSLWGGNTFSYEPNTEYMHFFRYSEHAKALVCKFGEIIAKCDIPDELIDQAGFGFYNMEVSVIPECIMKKENFNVNFIKGFKYQLTLGWTLPSIPLEEYKGRYMAGYGELYEQLFFDLKKEYYKTNPSETVNDYIASRLKGVNLDKLLLNYIDRVHEKRFPTKKSKLNLFKKR